MREEGGNCKKNKKKKVEEGIENGLTEERVEESERMGDLEMEIREGNISKKVRRRTLLKELCDLYYILLTGKTPANKISK